MKKSLLALLIICCSKSAVSQNNVGIGVTTPHSSALLELSSTNKGLLIPRSDTTSINMASKPAKGLLVYQLIDNTIYYYDGALWRTMLNSNSSLGNKIVLNTTRKTIDTISTQTTLYNVLIPGKILDTNSAIKGKVIFSTLHKANNGQFSINLIYGGQVLCTMAFLPVNGQSFELPGSYEFTIVLDKSTHKQKAFAEYTTSYSTSIYPNGTNFVAYGEGTVNASVNNSLIISVDGTIGSGIYPNCTAEAIIIERVY